LKKKPRRSRTPKTERTYSQKDKAKLRKFNKRKALTPRVKGKRNRSLENGYSQILKAKKGKKTAKMLKRKGKKVREKFVNNF
jgi:hypothetical protein